MQLKENNQFTAVVFGEVGQGKSTTLNSLVKLAEEKYFKGQDHNCKFEGRKDLKSVTSYIKMGSIGNMTLIDTPGLNDPETGRSDKNINIEIIKTLSNQLNDRQQGISSLILCVMPNASERITDSAIKGMNNMLFTFNSLDERTDIDSHPRVHIVFNNVSRFGENYDVE